MDRLLVCEILSFILIFIDLTYPLHQEGLSGDHVFRCRYVLAERPVVFLNTRLKCFVE